MATRYISVADTAKLIRPELKKAFPGIKFSVKSKSYSMGASISIKWTDGPTESMVKAIVGKYAGATFDGMQDLKEYHTSTLNGETVHFGADFVFTERHYSVPFLTRRAEKIMKKFGVTVEITNDTYGAHAKQDYSHMIGNRPAADYVWLEAQKTSAIIPVL